jgi:hypothetical protein
MKAFQITPSGPRIFVGEELTTIDLKAADITGLGASRQEITAIDIQDSADDIRLVPGTEFALTASYDASVLDFDCSVQNGVLTIRLLPRSGFGITNVLNFGVNLNTYELILTYPRELQLDRLTIDCDLGRVEIGEMSATTADFDLDLGDLQVLGLSSENLTAALDLGSASFTDCAANGSALFDMNMGSLTATRCSFANLDADCDMGSLDFAGTLTGRASINLAMGDCALTLDQSLDNIRYNLSCDMGSIRVNGREVGSRDMGAYSETMTAGDEELYLTVNNNMGSINLHTS